MVSVACKNWLIVINIDDFCSKSKPDEKLQICAGGVAGKSACRGDSGGGLFINDKLEDDAHFQIEPWYLFGIVSFGKSNCEAAVPEIYVR